MTGTGTTEHVSALAPFGNRAFKWLWIGVVISSVGAWAQMVGAQWLFISDPNAATIVALVQTASVLPMLLFGLAAGALADAFDRRRLLLFVQLYSGTVAIILAVLTWLDRMPPLLLLAFTFLIGAGTAMQVPTWQPLITELVPRSQIAQATRLDMVSVNVARAVGPAIAGLIIAAWGVPLVFLLTAVSALFLIGALLAWRRPDESPRARERFLPALRAGGRYVRHEPVVRLILGRLAVFVIPGTAMWTLLPLIANRQLGLGASGYGLLFAFLGLGAVAAALSLGRVTKHFSGNQVLSVGAPSCSLAPSRSRWSFRDCSLRSRYWRSSASPGRQPSPP